MMSIWHNHRDYEIWRKERVEEADRERALQEVRRAKAVSQPAWLHLLERWRKLLTAIAERPARQKNPAPRSNPTNVVLRLMAYRGEVYHLPGGHAIRVRSGRAWISHAGRDFVLGRGERATLKCDEDFALVSALDEKPLVIEMLGDPSHAHHEALINTPALPAY